MVERAERKTGAISPIERARKLLLALTAIAPALIGAPQQTLAQEQDSAQSGSPFSEASKTFGDFGKLMVELSKEKSAELQRAKKLGPEVEKAFIEKERVVRVLGDLKVHFGRLEMTLGEATEILSHPEVNLSDEFKRQNGESPVAFVRRAPAIIEQLKDSIRVQEEQVDNAIGRFLALSNSAEKDRAFREDVERGNNVKRAFEKLSGELDRRKTEEKLLEEGRARAKQTLTTPAQPPEPGPLEKNERNITRSVEIATEINKIMGRAIHGDVSADDIKNLEQLRQEQNSMKYENLPAPE